MREARAGAADDAAQQGYAHEIENQIVQRLGRRIRQLRVDVRDAGLVLHGQVHSYYVKQLAQQAVMEVGGLILTNDIEVC